MPTYTGINIKDLDTSTPTEGATPPSEVNDSIREIKSVYKKQNAVASKTADYTLTNADSVIYVSASGGNITLTLPQQSSVSSSTFIKEYIIIRTDTSSNTLTIDPYSTETVNGASTYIVPVLLSSTYPSVILLVGNGGTDWKGIISKEVAATVPLNSMQVFTSSGTWTKPSGRTKIRVQLVGGGGSGGGGNGRPAAGGGAGGYSEEIIDVSAVSSVSVTVGAGGAQVTSVETDGNNGGSSSFGAYLSATGGGGGLWNSGGAAGTSKGGSGGAGSGGDINITGGSGTSHSSQGTINVGGNGGASYFGGGGRAGSKDFAALPGQAYGSGGGGGGCGGTAAARYGEAGKAGIVIVYEY